MIQPSYWLVGPTKIKQRNGQMVYKITQNHVLQKHVTIINSYNIIIFLLKSAVITVQCSISYILYTYIGKCIYSLHICQLSVSYKTQCLSFAFTRIEAPSMPAWRHAQLFSMHPHWLHGNFKVDFQEPYLMGLICYICYNISHQYCSWIITHQLIIKSVSH